MTIERFGSRWTILDSDIDPGDNVTASAWLVNATNHPDPVTHREAHEAGPLHAGGGALGEALSEASISWSGISMRPQDAGDTSRSYTPRCGNLRVVYASCVFSRGIAPRRQPSRRVGAAVGDYHHPVVIASLHVYTASIIFRQARSDTRGFVDVPGHSGLLSGRHCCLLVARRRNYTSFGTG